MEKQQDGQDNRTELNQEMTKKSFLARNKGKIIGGAIAAIVLGFIGFVVVAALIVCGIIYGIKYYQSDKDSASTIIEQEYTESDETDGEYIDYDYGVEEEDGVAVEEEVIEEEPESAPTEKAVATEEDGGFVCYYPEIMAEFPEGPSELMSFIKRNLRYPDKAREKGVEGICVVEFAVNQDGSVSDFKVIKSLDPDCDQEAIRILKTMPKWKPGRRNGTAIKSKFTVPVAFRLPEDTPPATTEKSETTEQDEEDNIYEVAESMPEYPGGMGEMQAYINKNLKYPASALENGVQGRCIIQLVIEKDGSVSNTKVLRSVDPACDQEAMRIVQSMPKWKPATNYGKTVRVRYTIPITFRLNN